MANTLVPLVGGESASCAHSGATSSWKSRWSWLRCKTTRTAPPWDSHQDREEGERDAYTAEFRKTPPPQPELFSLFEAGPGGGAARVGTLCVEPRTFYQILDAPVPATVVVCDIRR